jgi:uroporphyrinogen-III synthase
MLAEADGAVVSKARLLQEAWPDESADEHVVEVTVGRLRRRLGAHGEAIQTVSRRGYRLRVVVGPQI